jgi:hypothetical protein
MFAAVAASTAAGVAVVPVAAKALGELHRAVFMSNTLARQGESIRDAGADERLARQRAGGIGGGEVSETDEPAYMGKLPRRAVAGDLRPSYVVKKGSATSSKGILSDILAKVPRQVHGTDSYKRIARPQPSRQAGFGNQSFPQ